MVVRYDNVNVNKTRVGAIIGHDKRTDMQKYKIGRHPASLHIIGNYNFESEFKQRIQSVNPNSLEFGNRKIEQPIFKFK